MLPVPDSPAYTALFPPSQLRPCSAPPNRPAAYMQGCPLRTASCPHALLDLRAHPPALLLLLSPLPSPHRSPRYSLLIPVTFSAHNSAFRFHHPHPPSCAATVGQHTGQIFSHALSAPDALLDLRISPLLLLLVPSQHPSPHHSACHYAPHTSTLNILFCFLHSLTVHFTQSLYFLHPYPMCCNSRAAYQLKSSAMRCLPPTPCWTCGTTPCTAACSTSRTRLTRRTSEWQYTRQWQQPEQQWPCPEQVVLRRSGEEI